MRSSKLVRVVLRLLFFVGLLNFFINVEAAENGGRKILKINLERNIIGRSSEKQIRVNSKFDLNYTIKRRIPNGPDPIHNRRAGNSRQPPGQA
ncbi:hypothetical protein DH2020_032615 [Rehmannia glutinosa]|uniref:CLAVATA3/ESR (CLE)-related protein n=1 Tax=Rehmannia glutinosa TaxID=99300 RepID=A0ABR0VIS1_REHGL